MTNQQTIGDAPIQPEMVKKMNDIAHILDRAMNPNSKAFAGGELAGGPKDDRDWGFILMVFPFDEVHGDGRCNYISNARRDDVVIMLKEQLARFEGQPEAKGTA